MRIGILIAYLRRWCANLNQVSKGIALAAGLTPAEVYATDTHAAGYCRHRLLTCDTHPYDQASHTRMMVVAKNAAEATARKGSSVQQQALAAALAVAEVPHPNLEATLK